jgi:pimeloyl-ACP methyl ester carboxylesterase
MQPLRWAVLASLAIACRSEPGPAPATAPYPTAPPSPAPTGSVRCGPATSGFYTPPALPPLSAQTLGTILRCEVVDDESADQLSRTPIWRQSAPPETPAQFGLKHYRILYLSQGPIGTPTAVSATVYLPTGAGGRCAAGTAAPIAAVQHGTTGVGDACAPSRETAFIDYMALPLVGRGFAVVATDYEGLGTPGVHPYLVGESEAYSVLDGLRALARLTDDAVDPGCLGRDVVLVGHSQGGQATLFAQQYAGSYGIADGMRLRGAVAWAPGFGARTITRASAGIPAATPMSTGFVLYTMYLYGMAHYRGAPPDSAWLSPAAQKALPELLEGECVLQLIRDLPARFPTAGSVFAKSFLDAPGAGPWADYGDANLPGSFHSDAPTLVVQGTTDDLVLPWTTQCIVDRMVAKGTRVDLCVRREGHLTIVGAAWPDVLGWVTAAGRGKAPVAPASCAGTLPACLAP